MRALLAGVSIIAVTTSSLLATEQQPSAVAFRKACAAGDTNACNNLAWMYAAGDGVPQDKAKAVALLRKACTGGNAKGCANLGV